MSPNGPSLNNQIRNSTWYTPELGDRYYSLYVSTKSAFDGAITGYSIFDEIRFVFLDYSAWCADPYGTGSHTCPNGDATQGAGGENFSSLAPRDWCAFWGHSYPCGDFPNRVELNLVKWIGTSFNGRVRLLLHETGHSFGLDHDCVVDSIMNTGASDCNMGRWLEVMEWQSVDRLLFRAIYLFYPYPP